MKGKGRESALLAQDMQSSSFSQNGDSTNNYKLLRVLTDLGDLTRGSRGDKEG